MSIMEVYHVYHGGISWTCIMSIMEVYHEYHECVSWRCIVKRIMDVYHDVYLIMSIMEVYRDVYHGCVS